MTVGYLQLLLQWTNALAISLQPGNDARSPSQGFEKQLVHFPHEARTKEDKYLSVHEVAYNTITISSQKHLHRQAEL